MKVIIVGCGNIGTNLTKVMCNENYDVVVIDQDANKIDEITNLYDCNGVVGNGCCSSTLLNAGIKETDAFIAVTNYDEANILCAKIASTLGAKKTIITLSSMAFINETSFLEKNIGIDYILNPKLLAAKEICHLIKYPDSLKVESFEEGAISIVNTHIKSTDCFHGKSILQIKKNLFSDLLIVAVERDSSVVIPNGDYVLQAGDHISIVVKQAKLQSLFDILGNTIKFIKSCFLIGGTQMGEYLINEMLSLGIEVKVLEESISRCQQLLNKYPKATILNGNYADSDLLKKELSHMDACISTTGQDELNLITTLFAKSLDTARCVTQIDDLDYAKMLTKSKIDQVFSTQDVTVVRILHYLRTLQNKKRISAPDNAIKDLYSLYGGRIEAVEFEITNDFPLTGISLADKAFRLKKEILIAALCRNNQWTIPDGTTSFQPGDKIIVISKEYRLANLDDICN